MGDVGAQMADATGVAANATGAVRVMIDLTTVVGVTDFEAAGGALAVPDASTTL